jgi:hypothetical protein
MICKKVKFVCKMKGYAAMVRVLTNHIHIKCKLTLVQGRQGSQQFGCEETN